MWHCGLPHLFFLLRVWTSMALVRSAFPVPEVWSWTSRHRFSLLYSLHLFLCFGLPFSLFSTPSSSLFPLTRAVFYHLRSSFRVSFPSLLIEVSRSWLHSLSLHASDWTCL